MAYLREIKYSLKTHLFVFFQSNNNCLNKGPFSKRMKDPVFNGQNCNFTSLWIFINESYLHHYDIFYQ